jgi:glucokinase
MPVYVGLDIGGTKFMAAAGDGAGRVCRSKRTRTPTALDEGLSLLHEMVQSVSAGEPIAGIGAAIGGPLNWQTGVVSPLHQPQWRSVPLKQIMEDRWNCPFHVDVDTNVAALGEYRLGDETAPRFLYLTLSTGMGGGFLLDGQIYRGMNGEHPEVAHQAIPFRCSHPDRIACACGNPDCLEALVSGNGIRRVYQKPPEQLDPTEWNEVAWNLGQGLRNLAAIYLPDTIAIGGGIAHGQGESLLAPARTVMQQHLKIVPPPTVRLSGQGYDTALMGSLVIARFGLQAAR